MRHQVEPDTVSSDSFMVNIQAILLRFCEPFMDANFSKVCATLESKICAENAGPRLIVSTLCTTLIHPALS